MWVAWLDSNNRLSIANLRFHLFRSLVLPMLPRRAEAPGCPPVVIGAMGGSGTRVLTQILRLSGYWMGAWINCRTQDALATRFFLQRYFEHLVASPERDDVRVLRCFDVAIRAHRFGMPDRGACWGWKNPRSMWVIPFLARRYPEMRFLHLVRDGRDMALSENHNLLRKHGHLLLAERLGPGDRLGDNLELWTRGNAMALRMERGCSRGTI